MKKNYLLKIIILTICILIISPAATYGISMFFKRLELIPAIGSADTWIGFAGSIIGGSITMIALYFTVKQEQDILKKNMELSIKPFIYCDFACKFVSNASNDREMVIGDCVHDYAFIKWTMTNASNNVANNVKIVDQIDYVQDVKTHMYTEVDNLQAYGVLIFTVLFEDSIFIPPNGSQLWKTNFLVETNDDGTYKWHENAFAFKHAIIYEFSDMANSKTYTGKFEFEININVDNKNRIRCFLWNSSNSIQV